MIRLARMCFKHRRRVVGAWLAALVVILIVSQAAGTDFNSDFNLPNTDSQATVSLLEKNFPTASGENDQVVVEATHGATVRTPAVKKAFAAALAKVEKVPGIASVGSPYSKAGAAQISPDGSVAFATVTWDTVTANVTKSD